MRQGITLDFGYYFYLQEIYNSGQCSAIRAIHRDLFQVNHLHNKIAIKDVEAFNQLYTVLEFMANNKIK